MGFDIDHTIACSFSRTSIDSPSENKPSGNYFMENECVRFLCTKSEVAEDERVSTENEWDFLYVSRSE